jgi:hypothetical protein
MNPTICSLDLASKSVDYPINHYTFSNNNALQNLKRVVTGALHSDSAQIATRF